MSLNFTQTCIYKPWFNVPVVLAVGAESDWCLLFQQINLFFILLLSSADFFQNKLFQKILSGTLSVCHTVWIQILSVLIWVQTVCKGYQQTTKVSASKEIDKRGMWIYLLLFIGPGREKTFLRRFTTMQDKIHPFTLYSILTPLKFHVFENIMENGAFAPLEQMLHFP